MIAEVAMVWASSRATEEIRPSRLHNRRAIWWLVPAVFLAGCFSPQTTDMGCFDGVTYELEAGFLSRIEPSAIGARVCLDDLCHDRVLNDGERLWDLAAPALWLPSGTLADVDGGESSLSLLLPGGATLPVHESTVELEEFRPNGRRTEPVCDRAIVDLTAG
jgi:hypothetical protein